MAIDRRFRSDRHTRRFAPLIGHWTAEICLNQDGSLVTMCHLAGFEPELAGQRANRANTVSANQLAHDIGDPRIEVWDHFVRRDHQPMSALPPVDNFFAARFDAAYRATQGDGKLYRNDHFVTIVMHPRDDLRGDIRAMVGGTREHPEPDDAMIEELEAVRARVEAALPVTVCAGSACACVRASISFSSLPGT